MKIYQQLSLDLNKKELISIVGAGGKTSLLFLLGQELKEEGKKVLLSTTTAIYKPESGFDHLFIGDLADFRPEPASITVLGQELRDGKLRAVDLDYLEDIWQKGTFDYILIEADGANKNPIKAPADHEPVISSSTSKTIGIIGLDSLGHPLEEIAHRPKLMGKILNQKGQEIIDSKSIIKLVEHDQGLFKASKGEKILLLNKADREERIEAALQIKKSLYIRNFSGKIIVADILSKNFY